MSTTLTGNGRPLERTKEPGIYRRGNRYVVLFRDEQGRKRKRAAGTLAEARTIRATVTADVARGEYKAVSRVTFSEYAPKWLATYTGRTRRGIGARTLDMYRTDLGFDIDGNVTGKGAAKFFGPMQLTAIGPAELTDFAAQLSRRGLSRSSVRRALAPVKALLATAHEQQLIRFNPCAGVRIVTPAREGEESFEKIKALAPDKLSAVLAAIPEEWRLFVQFLAETGLRIGEAIEVRWSDLDRGERRLEVARQWHRGEVGLPKGRKVRRIPVSTRLDGMLWEHRKATKAADGDLVFTGPQGARVDAKNLAARVLKPACTAAGVGTWPTWHTFRHSCATQLFRNGWNASQVSRFLGHADAGFTLRTYVHLLDEDLPEPDVLDSLDVLEAARNGGTTGAPEATETNRNPDEVGEAATPVPMPLRAIRPNQAETAGSDYESAALTS